MIEYFMVTISWYQNPIDRPCAVDVRRFHITDFFCVMNGKRMVVFALSKHLEADNVVQFPIGNYQTTEIHQISVCSWENAAGNGYHYTVLYSTLPLKLVDVLFISVYYPVIFN